MSDYFSEYIVKRRTPQKVKLIKALLVVLCVFSVVLIIIPYIGMILTAVMIFFTWLYFRNNDVEWEYTLVEKSLYVDKIMQKAKRKRIAEYDLTKMEVMAVEESDLIKEYDRRNLRRLDFTSLIPENKRYVIVIMHNNELIKVALEPSERMLKEMRDVAPRKVHV